MNSDIEEKQPKTNGIFTEQPREGKIMTKDYIF
jgi:hypothetical protein